MKTIFLTSLLTILGLIIASAFISGPEWLLLGILYIPANLGIPVLVIIICHHLLKTNLFKSEKILVHYLVFMTVVSLFFVFMFFTDYLFFNNDRTLKKLFEIDYESWVYHFGVGGIIIVPIIYKLVREKYLNNNMSNKDKITQEEIREALGEFTDKDLIPHYKTVYSHDSVELVNIDTLLSQDKIDQWTCLTILANSCKELKADFNNYLLDFYGTLEVTDDRLTYSDIGNIAGFIVWKFKSNETDCFDRIFESAEIILENGDETTRTLIVVGLFEGIQNVGGWHKVDVDYYKGFDKWLRPQSKKAWDDVIEFWERMENE